MSDNTNKYQVLLDVVRQNYASVVWTHKIQIKQADTKDCNSYPFVHYNCRNNIPKMF